MQEPVETYWRARNNVIQMFIDRNYRMIKAEDGSPGTTEDLKNLYLSLDDFKRNYFPETMKMVGIETKDGLPVYVIMVYNYDSVPIDNADKIYSSSKASGIINDIAGDLGLKIAHDGKKTETKLPLKEFLSMIKLVIVYNTKPKTKNRYDTSAERGFAQPEYPNIELWPVHKLQVNLARHVKVDPHFLLTDAQKQEVLDRFNANAQMLTQYTINDPLNRYYDGKPGEVYKISTNNGMAPRFAIVVARKRPERK